uniref:Voltage-dependent calcium channel subunit alpha-2/delta-2-like isoform X2 n=1 Tax=Petromyzon marinus TaxID=7757 RepID=A0AAJ7TZ82_PETMA|nr:voltage-dependent calcium channel subunit alpha-2/delta-2-like isoform X2 [Petromyzon marinus]
MARLGASSVSSLPPPLLLPPLLLLVVVVAPTLLIRSTLANSFPQRESIQYWATRISTELDKVLHQASGMDQLREIYHKHKSLFELRRNEAEHLVNTASIKIKNLLSKRVHALEKLTKAAEDLQKRHTWKDHIQEADVSYYDAKQHVKCIPDDREARSDETSRSDSRVANESFTAVHIPTDIYNGSSIILNELYWTAGLEQVFKENKRQDPKLLWQVFGSATGLTRYYPALPWSCNPKKVDLYDVRRRPWYIQGAASPKDMVILVDVSGSVSGLTLSLMKKSVTNMLATLADDDYVNVVSFNNTAYHVSCFTHLVQANVRNKKVLKEAVEKMTSRGLTNYSAGLEFAFQQLFNHNISRANCNRMIMLFTDGGEDRAQDIFELYNWPNKTVRVFTFSVGQHNYDVTPIQWMACANKGYYFEIPSIGAIRINTQEYLDVLGRPMVLAGPRGKQVQWTNVYLDALEQGLVITGTLPVFNLSASGNVQNQLILGVMGVDVSLKEIKELTDQFNLGANGYFFAIDPNGYVLLHPNFLPKLPNFQEPVTLDFVDAELESARKLEIRASMINGENKSMTFETLVKSLDERYVDRVKRTYTWTQVESTDYSLAVVLPHYSLFHIKALLSGDEITQAAYFETLSPSSTDAMEHVFIAPRDYCKNMVPSANNNNNTEFLLNFIATIERDSPNSPDCNQEMIYNLLLDARITADLVEQAWLDLNMEEFGIQAVFVATDAGVTRVFSYGLASEWLEEPEPYNASYYKRSLDNAGFVYRAPTLKSPQGSILSSRAIELTFNEHTLKPAVVGVKLDVEAWTSKFKILATNRTAAGGGGGGGQDTCDGFRTYGSSSCEMDCEGSSEELLCVILDDGGFLVLSNNKEHTNLLGSFFGTIDGALMSALYNASLYAKVESFDYQSVCGPRRANTSASTATHLHTPSLVDLVNLAWWSTAALWSLLQQLLFSLLLGTTEYSEPASAFWTDYADQVSCVTLQTQFYFPNNETSFHQLIDCGNCSRLFHAEKLPGSNLVFVVAENILCSHCHITVLTQADRESEGHDSCAMVRTPRVRRGPESCFDYNTTEDSSQCGKASSLGPSVPAVVGLQVLGLWLLPLLLLPLPSPAPSEPHPS